MSRNVSVDLENWNMSARQDALNHWTAMDKHWKILLFISAVKLTC